MGCEHLMQGNEAAQHVTIPINFNCFFGCVIFARLLLGVSEFFQSTKIGWDQISILEILCVYVSKLFLNAPLVESESWWRLRYKGRHQNQKTFQFGHCPKVGGDGGVTLARIFLTRFFDQLIVPKKVIFYPKLTIFVVFQYFLSSLSSKLPKFWSKLTWHLVTECTRVCGGIY